MYWIDTWRFSHSIEYEIKYAGKYGAKGEKRKKRKKATPEQIKKQNQQNREKYVRRLIKANFTLGDYWATLKYPEGTRKTIKQIRKDLKGFLDSVRKAYKKHGKLFKFILRIEIGKNGGIHIHILFNRGNIKNVDMLIQQKWKHGRVNFQTLYEEGGYDRLAKYIVKEPDEEQYEQLQLFEQEEQKQLVKYSTSRNLIRPQAERKFYRRRTVRKVIENGPQPSAGYYIDQDSVVMGENPYTGMSYIHYTECLLEGGKYEKG